MDESHVLGLLPKCSDAAVLERDAAKDDPRLKGEDEYRYMLVMDRADGDLSDALSHSRVAGRDPRDVVELARQVAGHLPYLHAECNRCLLYSPYAARDLTLTSSGRTLRL